MPTPTTRNRIIQQDLASNVNRWGAPILNDALERLDESLDGILTLDGSLSSIVLDNTNYVQNQARYRMLTVTGAQTQNCVITVPNVQKHWWVRNLTTGGSWSVSLKTVAGSAVICARGANTLVVCDGANCIQYAPGSLSDLSPPTGDLDMNGHRVIDLADGTNSNHAATVGQVTAAMGAPSPYLQLLLQMVSS